jgi:hypothetical protein
MNRNIAEYTNDELRAMPDGNVLFRIEREAANHLWDAPPLSIRREPIAFYTCLEQAAVVRRARRDVADQPPPNRFSFQAVPTCHVTDEEFARLRAYLREEFAIKMSLHMLGKKV